MAEDPEASRQRRAPTTASGEAWRRAEQLNERLAETGDSPQSFVVKGLIGMVVMLGLAGGLLWLLYKVVRWVL